MLFVCASCRGVDSTALAPDYYRRGRARGQARCTRCATGRWHRWFPERQYDPAADGPIDARQQIHPEH